MRYRYEAVAISGKLVTGEMEAQSQSALVAELHRQGHVPIRAEPASRWNLSGLVSTDLLKPRARSLRQLLVLTEQLATLLQAGLALDRALEIARQILTRSIDRDVAQTVLDKVRSGSTLADAMAAEETFFPHFYVGMVRAGEAGGTLDGSLRKIADYLRRSLTIAEETKSALIYPSLVVVTGVGTVAMLLGSVVPQFRPMLEQNGNSLPLAAQAVLALSDFVNADGTITLAVLALLALAGRQILKRPGARRRRDALLLRVPQIGAIVAKIETGRFAMTLGTLLANGMAPLGALKIAREAVANQAIAAALEPLGAALKAGRPLAEAIGGIRQIPPLAAQLIRAGEEAGRLDDMLIKVAEIFDEEAKRSITRLLALLIPAITILLGIVVAAIVGSLLTAILSVYDIAA